MNFVMPHSRVAYPAEFVDVVRQRVADNLEHAAMVLRCPNEFDPVQVAEALEQMAQEIRP